MYIVIVLQLRIKIYYPPLILLYNFQIIPINFQNEISSTPLAKALIMIMI